MDKKRLKYLAGITEQTRFRDAGEMLQTALFNIKELRNSYAERVRKIETTAHDVSEQAEAITLEDVITDLDDLLLRFKDAQVTPRR